MTNGNDGIDLSLHILQMLVQNSTNLTNGIRMPLNFAVRCFDANLGIRVFTACTAKPDHTVRPVFQRPAFPDSHNIVMLHIIRNGCIADQLQHGGVSIQRIQTCSRRKHAIPHTLIILSKNQLT